MNATIAQFIARHPRFDVVDDSKLLVTAEIDVDGILERLEASLINISRRGVRMHVPADLAESDTLIIEIKHKHSDLNVRRHAQVQWSAEVADGVNVIGCQLDEDISWETMGEFFLMDAISPEE